MAGERAAGNTSYAPAARLAVATLLLACLAARPVRALGGAQPAGGVQAATVRFGRAETMSGTPVPVYAPLTTVRQVHQLSVEAASARRPIHLHGVVTAVSSWPNAFFFQDGTGGISIEATHPTAAANGAEVDVFGYTGPGLFAPVAAATDVRVLGKGKMPRAHLFTYSELTGGVEDSSWIEIRGVVRGARAKVQWSKQVVNLILDADGGLVTIQLIDYPLIDALRLVDAVVRVRGVCTTTFNDKRQFTGIGMNVPSIRDIVVEEPATADPYSVSPTPVRNLMQFKPGVRFGHRVQVTGTVTYQDLGHSLYVQDGADGVMVETEQRTPLPLGTHVAVVGFPTPGAYSPILSEAIFQVQRPGVPATPIEIHASDALRRDKFVTAPYDAQLVHIHGQLVETTARLGDAAWLIRDGDTHFLAVLKQTQGTVALPRLQNGSMIAVTGVVTVQVGESREPTAFRVLLRGPADLVVVRRASWWTAGHALAVAGVMLVVILAVALWGALLRRTVRKQTQMLRESEERFRNQAQHDTLTGLASRSFLCEQLHEAIDRAQWSGRRFGVLMVDLDHFKEINDTLGHHAGDELLRVVAARLRASVRKGDTVARMGGDEFVVLLANLDDPAEAEAIGAQVVARVSTPAAIDDRTVLVSASVGVCLYPEGGDKEDALLQNVDAAMYKAKAAGRNNFAVYTTAASQAKLAAPAQELARA